LQETPYQILFQAAAAEKKSVLITTVLDTQNHQSRWLLLPKVQEQEGQRGVPELLFSKLHFSSCWSPTTAPAKRADLPSAASCCITAASLVLTPGREQPCSQLDQAIDLSEN